MFKKAFIIAAFVMGFALGVYLAEVFVQESKVPDPQIETVEALQNESELDISDDAYLMEIEQLNVKIIELKNELLMARDESSDRKLKNDDKNAENVKPLTKSMLIDAGINEFIAEEIIKRKEEREYKYLELRDSAVREGYINTAKFRKQLSQIKHDGFIIKNELGDDVYDRYLYAEGKSNRVMVLSLMQNSPAEHAGILVGDTIVSYNGERIFSWQELTRATSKGRRDEAVILDIQRNDERFNILVPRGPLGIKLRAERVLP